MRKLLRILVILSGIISAPVLAYQLRPMNLGDTSYFDGLNFPTGPGWYFLMTTEYYQADKFLDNNGDLITGQNGPNLNYTVVLPQLVYETKSKPILNAHVGLDAIQPILLDINLDQPNLLGLTDNGAGLGDLMAGPFLQWDTVVKNGRPLYGTRIEFDTYFPTGKYNSAQTINPGTNTYSFEPYWAATVFLSPKWELSWRWHYLTNLKNPSTQLEAGDATHINVASSYAITQKFRLGVSGYYLKQLSDSEFNGTDIPNSKEQVLGIGPGFVYIFNKGNYVTANYYHETLVRNRTEGDRASLLFVHFID